MSWSSGECVHCLHYCSVCLTIVVLFFRELLEKELESVGIRLNCPKPNIYFKVSVSGFSLS